MARGLRLMIFDQTCRRDLPAAGGLSHVWEAGSLLYRWLGRLDAVRGASDWAEALHWAATVQPDHPIAEIQFWGHGKWGCAMIDRAPLDRDALHTTHSLHKHLRQIAERMSPDSGALWWFRTCETFGAQAGHDFAQALTDFFGCRAAGHTFQIAFHQSGLHSLAAGNVPSWPPEEGLAAGTPREPKKALWSSPRATHTITCLTGKVPESW